MNMYLKRIVAAAALFFAIAGCAAYVPRALIDSRPGPALPIDAMKPEKASTGFTPHSRTQNTPAASIIKYRTIYVMTDEASASETLCLPTLICETAVGCRLYFICLERALRAI